MSRSKSNFMEWLVKNRSDNQQSTLDLLNLSIDYRDLIDSDSRLRMALGTLTSVCFSLWRAVFLAGLNEESTEAIVVSTEEFLENLVLTNNVTFATDVKYNEWSFRYYMFNAQLALSWLEKNAEELHLVVGYVGAEGSIDEPLHYWKRTHDTLSDAIAALKKNIQVKEATGVSVISSGQSNPLA